MQISNKITQLIEQPKHRLLNPTNIEDFNFSYSFEVPNSNGIINFKMVISENDVIGKVMYETNITGVPIAFLEATCDLITNKKLEQVSFLKFREIENFLRDNNSTQSTDVHDPTLIRVMQFLDALKESFAARIFSKNKTSKTSPDLNDDYEILRQNKNFTVDDFMSLELDQKKIVIENIFDHFIRPGLYRDGGDVECVHIGDDLVVINYKGECTGCDSSLTSTMDYIQNVLRKELKSPSLFVVTDS